MEITVFVSTKIKFNLDTFHPLKASLWLNFIIKNNKLTTKLVKMNKFASFAGLFAYASAIDVMSWSDAVVSVDDPDVGGFKT